MSLWKKEGRVRRTLWSPPEGVELQADPGEIQPFKAGGAVEGGSKAHILKCYTTFFYLQHNI